MYDENITMNHQKQKNLRIFFFELNRDKRRGKKGKQNERHKNQTHDKKYVHEQQFTTTIWISKNQQRQHGIK